MRTKENTLVLGNGFSRTIFKQIPSWNSLFNKTKSVIRNYTILYEVNLLKGKYTTDADAKNDLIEKINHSFSTNNIKRGIRDLEHFGILLDKHNIKNIITTNYDKGIEIILCNICGYDEITPKGMVAEIIYSIRTHKEFINKKTGHHVKLWKIHGDISRIQSVTLGFDQYCGSISKLSNYIKGKYSSDKGVKCTTPMEEKCRNENLFDGISWAELFFRTNVYIIGLGLDFSEIDIWWLLNKRKRIEKGINQEKKKTQDIVKNKIYYLYDIRFDSLKKKKDIFQALRAFGVKKIGIRSNANYLKNIFNQIK